MQVEMSTRSTNRSFKKLITERDDVSPDDIYQALCNQNVELVFTAHPTQVYQGWNITSLVAYAVQPLMFDMLLLSVIQQHNLWHLLWRVPAFVCTHAAGFARCIAEEVCQDP